MLTSTRDQNEGTCRSGDGGGGPATNSTLDLSYYWEGAREWCEDNNWDEEKQMLQKYIISINTTHSTPTFLQHLFFVRMCLFFYLSNKY